MAYSKKVIDKFENTLNEPHKNSVGRWDPKEEDICIPIGEGENCW